MNTRRGLRINTNMLSLSFLLLYLTTLARSASSTVVVRPSTGRAAIVPGQALFFQCEMTGNPGAQFLWYRKLLSQHDQSVEELLEPNLDDNIEIHNERLTINKPTYSMAGDYICRALEEGSTAHKPNEFSIIKLRTQPYIEDFGLDTSHTGKSGIIADGERLELTCTVRDRSSDVNITWLRSMTPDDEHTMVPLAESPTSLSSATTEKSNLDEHLVAPSSYYPRTFTAPDQDIIVQKLSNHSKRLIIESIKHEHRSYYVCMVDNGVTERSRKMIFIRVKDKLVALWPLLGILAELFILFTIIHVWETRRAYKEINSPTTTPPSPPGQALTSSKRPASGATVPYETVPLTSG